MTTTGRPVSVGWMAEVVTTDSSGSGWAGSGGAADGGAVATDGGAQPVTGFGGAAQGAGRRGPAAAAGERRGQTGGARLASQLGAAGLGEDLGGVQAQHGGLLHSPAGGPAGRLSFRRYIDRC